MDFFAHGLWTYAIFHRKKYRWWAVLFGLLPDVLSFGLFLALNLASGTFPRGAPRLSTIPAWVFQSYNWTHSLVIFGIAFALIFIFTKKWLWPLTGWAIHIITDIPTHSASFFPTPFLWPASKFSFNGIGWTAPWFMAANYLALIAVLVVIARKNTKDKKKKKRR